MPMILSLLDKIDSRLENTNNANLIKYFFESNYNSLLDSLNAFFQDEILNNDNIVECYKFIKKYPCIKNI